MAGSQGPRIWHGGYRSYEEALRKAKTIIYGEGAWINCGLCHPQCVSPDRDHRPSGCGQFHRYRRSAGKPSGPEVRAAVRPKVPRKPGLWPHRQLRLRIAAGGHGVYHFFFATGFSTSRAQSMKSCATGLRARFFRVTIPLGGRAIGSSTGRALISERLVGNRNAEAGKIVTKRPVARRLIRTWGESVTTVVRG